VDGQGQSGSGARGGKTAKRIGGELGGVFHGGLKSAEFQFQIISRERAKIGEFPALHAFGEERGDGDGGGAATAEEACVADDAGFDDGGEAEGIAADGIGDLDAMSGGGKIADVAGAGEVVEELRAIHGRSIAARAVRRKGVRGQGLGRMVKRAGGTVARARGL